MNDDLLTIEQAAGLLGMTPESLAHNLVYKGAIPSVTADKYETVTRPVRLVSRTDIERYQSTRARPKLPHGYISVAAAARRIGVSRQLMYASPLYSGLLEDLNASKGGAVPRYAVSLKRLEAFLEERANVQPT
jgi:hypothetical protein